MSHLGHTGGDWEPVSFLISGCFAMLIGLLIWALLWSREAWDKACITFFRKFQVLFGDAHSQLLNELVPLQMDCLKCVDDEYGSRQRFPRRHLCFPNSDFRFWYVLLVRSDISVASSMRNLNSNRVFARKEMIEWRIDLNVKKIKNIDYIIFLCLDIKIKNTLRHQVEKSVQTLVFQVTFFVWMQMKIFVLVNMTAREKISQRVFVILYISARTPVIIW